ncbi:MAG: DsbA family protein [Thioalkalivibrio sp.]|nr:DsbA family protein [Thioalkalivibrio sp.]
MSTTPTASFYFDFVDPLSFLVERELLAVEARTGWSVERIGLEISPPPHPLATPGDPPWAPRWEQASAIAAEMGIALSEPRVVPWSRKAHELLRHAETSGKAAEIRESVFRAYFLEGLDIGRVDVLVARARGAGLDVTESKAVLDVDRFGEDVAARRDAALQAGVHTVPLLVSGPHRLEGFHNRASLSTFLEGSS